MGKPHREERGGEIRNPKSEIRMKSEIRNLKRRSRATARWSAHLVLSGLLLVTGVFGGCKQRRIDQALESDANGYLCQVCKAKFYTDRAVFANVCPSCKSTQLAQVVGFVCP